MLRKCILKNERLFRDQTQKPPIVARSSEAYLISKNSYDMEILAKAKSTHRITTARNLVSRMISSTRSIT